MAIESMITGIQHIGIPCANLDETTAFTRASASS